MNQLFLDGALITSLDPQTIYIYICIWLEYMLDKLEVGWVLHVNWSIMGWDVQDIQEDIWALMYKYMRGYMVCDEKMEIETQWTASIFQSQFDGKSQWNL